MEKIGVGSKGSRWAVVLKEKLATMSYPGLLTPTAGTFNFLTMFGHMFTRDVIVSRCTLLA